MKLNLICGDCLEVMQAMESCTVDLIYLDPPYNKNKKFVSPPGKFRRPVGFDDRWIDDDTYLVFIRDRLRECHRLLKGTGSLYLHVDQVMSHYLKIELDRIFGKANFRNEIAWCYNRLSGVKRRFALMHDSIFFYAKDCSDYKFNPGEVKCPLTPKTVERWQYDSTQSTGMMGGSKGPFTKEQAAEIIRSGKIMNDYWLDIPVGSSGSSREYTGYPTQKPLKLLDRIIRASTDEGDMVLDPFCGSGTTLTAAKMLNRKYMGIDLNPDAIEISGNRLNEASMTTMLFKNGG